MHKSGLTAIAVLVAASLPFAIATDAMAQGKVAPGGGGGAARAAPAAPAGPVGGGGIKSGGMVGGGAAVGGGAVASGPVGGGGAFKGGVVGSAPGPRIGPQATWSGPRPDWRGGHHRHHRHHHHRHLGFGFGTGLLFGGAYAASPYYYDDPYYYDYPYDGGYVVSGTAASPEDVAYCRQRYRSYDIRTGTFLGNDGRRHPCP
jgi:hypothetical protein